MTDSTDAIHIHLPDSMTAGEVKTILERIRTRDTAYDLASAILRHREPHDCPREDPSSACDFNRFRQVVA